MKSAIVSLFAVLLILSTFALPAKAATQAQIDTTIANGLAYLASVQNLGPSPPAGSWGTSDLVARTATVLLKFETHAKQKGLDPFDDNPSSSKYYQYATNVIAGMNYLLSQAQVVSPLPMQTHDSSSDNPDSSPNGQGIAWLPEMLKQVYSTGLVLSAISESCHPNDRSYTINSISYTYKQIAQDAADWLAYAQSDVGAGEGGWRYWALDNAGDGYEDNSVSGYAVLGLAYAVNFGCIVPLWVKTELNIWIDNIQDDVTGDTNDGGSWYEPNYAWVNILKTGNLIFEMAFYGDNSNTQRVKDAVDYLERHWQDMNVDPGWGYNMNPAAYQAMFATMKGLEYMGIDKIDTDGDTLLEDWFNQEPTAVPSQDFASVIVAQQGTGNAPAPGAWPQSYWDYEDNCILSTAWAMLTLQKAAPPPPPIGGRSVSIGGLQQLAPWVGLASLMVLATASVVFVRFRKKRQT